MYCPIIFIQAVNLLQVLRLQTHHRGHDVLLPSWVAPSEDPVDLHSWDLKCKGNFGYHLDYGLEQLV